MDSPESVKMPVAQIVYGEIVYWVTIVSALICMVGPVVALASPEHNLLNPHYLFANIFNGESPAGVWALSSTAEVELEARTEAGAVPPITVHQALEILEKMPAANGAATMPMLAFDTLSVTSAPEEDGERMFLVDPPGEKMDFEDCRERILERYSREVFHNGHFWARCPSCGDGFTQIGLALGCSVALWSLLITAGAFVKDRIYLYTFLALWVSALVFLSAAGIISGGH